MKLYFQEPDEIRIFKDKSESESRIDYKSKIENNDLEILIIIYNKCDSNLWR